MAGGNEANKAQLRVAGEQRRASREALLRPHTRFDEPFIQSLGASVKIKSMSFARREALQDLANVDGEFDRVKFTVLSIIECLVEPQLTEEDVEALKLQDIAIIDELSLAITYINLPGGGAEEGKDNSRRTPNSASDSSSPND